MFYVTYAYSKKDGVYDTECFTFDTYEKAELFLLDLMSKDSLLFSKHREGNLKSTLQELLQTVPRRWARRDEAHQKQNHLEEFNYKSEDSGFYICNQGHDAHGTFCLVWKIRASSVVKAERTRMKVNAG